MKTMLDFYCYLGDKFLGYRGYMGSNLDALDDMLIEISEESIRKTKIYLFDFDSFNKKMNQSKKAKKNNIDYLLIDTAGRLQNKKNLMDEFKKIINVLKKIDSNSPNEIFLILDATTGQSAINQVQEFQKITPITGIIMNKLDGTAKGGILLAISKKFKLPIIALGMGEKEDDLQIFDAHHYANAMMISEN